MQPHYLYKAGGILLNQRKFLPERHGGKNIYIIPGGKLEKEETAAEALIREFQEEFHIILKPQHLDAFGSFESVATHNPDYFVHITMFLVKTWSGDFMLDGGIEGITWVNSTNIHDFKLSSIAREQIFPLLLGMNLID